MKQPKPAHPTEPLPAPSIEGLFPVAVVAFRAAIDPVHVDGLLDGERDAGTTMAPGRRAEFASGRACARAALAAFGLVPKLAIPRGTGGQPEWPAGITGSITHSEGQAIAVVGSRRDPDVVVGLDLERVDRVRLDLARRILTAAERDHLGTVAAPEAQRRLATAFAIKEAFYKAHHQIDPRWLGFDAVEVDHEPAVRIRAHNDVDPALVGTAVAQVLERDGLVAAAVTLSAGGSRQTAPG